MKLGSMMRALGTTVMNNPVKSGLAILVAERVITSGECRPGLGRVAVDAVGVGLLGVGALVAGAKATGAGMGGAAGVLGGRALRDNPVGPYATFPDCVRSKAATPGIRHAKAYCGGILRASGMR